MIDLKVLQLLYLAGIVTIVGIITIRNQPNNTTLAPYKLLFSVKESFKSVVQR